MSKAKIALEVEGKVFNSLKEACEYLQLKDSAGLSHALRRGQTTFKGLQIKPLNLVPERLKKMKKNNRLECPVICETLNLHFRNIKMAAAYAQVDGWTMSKKMQAAGQFKDKNGNIYKRVKPMKSKNVYENTGDTVKHQRVFAHRTVNKEAVMEPVVNKIEEPKVVDVKVVEQSFSSGIILARNILKEKVSEYIKSDNFTVAKELLSVIEKLDK